jgi:uncharacterized protein (TIGR00645 family)
MNTDFESSPTSPEAVQPNPRGTKQLEHSIEKFIFASRWLQAPLFLGLIAASLLYAIRFLMELVKLIPAMIYSPEPEPLLLGVLGLVDMIMVANLIVMIVIGGYTLFVSKLNIDAHEDKPEWLDKTSAATLKIKLASALVGVSGIHLLKTFIELGGEAHGGTSHEELQPHFDNMKIMWQVIIHTIFLLSAIGLSWSERILHPPEAGKHH